MVTLCVMVLCVAAVDAQDWPQWRGQNRDGRVVNWVPPGQPPVSLDKGWSVEVGLGDATPALVGDKLYLHTRKGAEEVIACLNASDGSQVWEVKYAAAEVGGPAASHPGPRSSPAVAEGKVVTLGVAGVVTCVDAESGEQLWQKDPFPNVVPMFFASCSPMIADGMAIAHLGGQGTGALMAFDLETGDVKWQWDAEGAEYGSPTLMTVDGTQQVVTLTEKSVVGVALADGALLWQIPFAPEGRTYNSVTPIIDGDKVIFSASGRGTYAVRIEKQGDGFAPVEVWSNGEIGVQFSTPVLANGRLFGLTAAGNLFCMNAETGELVWGSDEQLGRGGFGSVVDLGLAIVALAVTGELIALEPTANEYQEMGRFRVADTQVYAHPVISENRFFIKDEANLTVWTMP